MNEIKILVFMSKYFSLIFFEMSQILFIEENATPTYYVISRAMLIGGGKGGNCPRAL